MIVPRSRLLLWVAAVVLPFATVGAVVPESATVAVALITGLFAVVLADAALAFGRLDGIQIELPRLTRLSQDREGQLELRVRNTPPKARHIRLGLAFPPGIGSRLEDQWTALPDGAEWSRLTWPCTGLHRGRYRLDACYLEGVSPLGFWALHARAPAAAEIRVYPGLREERKHLAALFLHRGAFGLHPRRQLGKGREFEKLREYAAGDSFDEIHWKATAKRGHPITKVFQIERTQEVYVVLDASRLSARPLADGAPGIAAPPSAIMLERFITAALVLGLVAERQGDLFGLLAFNRQVVNFVRARNGSAHYRSCRDALYTLEPRLESPDFDELFSFLRLRLRRRALLVFLTCLDDPVLAESFVRNVDQVCRHHLVLVNTLRPRGVEPVFARQRPATAEALYAVLSGHLRWQELRELEQSLQHRGVSFKQLDNERMCAQLVSQYLSVKQRQVL